MTRRITPQALEMAVDLASAVGLRRIDRRRAWQRLDELTERDPDLLRTVLFVAVVNLADGDADRVADALDLDEHARVAMFQEST